MWASGLDGLDPRHPAVVIHWPSVCRTSYRRHSSSGGRAGLRAHARCAAYELMNTNSSARRSAVDLVPLVPGELRCDVRDPSAWGTPHNPPAVMVALHNPSNDL
jgi:hypothetical protein